MPRDNVLRVLLCETIDGQREMRIYDALDKGENYQIVIEWTYLPEDEAKGEFPNKAISLNKKFFQVIESTTAGYELFLTRPIDFSVFFKTPPTILEEDDVFSNPDNLFQRAPDAEVPPKEP